MQKRASQRSETVLFQARRSRDGLMKSCGVVMDPRGTLCVCGGGFCVCVGSASGGI